MLSWLGLVYILFYFYVALSDRCSMPFSVILPRLDDYDVPSISIKLYFNVPLSSNCGEKVLNGILILSRVGHHFNAIYKLFTATGGQWDNGTMKYISDNFP